MDWIKGPNDLLTIKEFMDYRGTVPVTKSELDA
jgi:hypothetical protein